MVCVPSIPATCVIDGAKNVVEGGVSSVAGSAIEKFAEAVQEAVASALAALGTLWVNIGTPNLTEGTAAGRNAGATPPGAGMIETVLSYMLYIGLGVCILSLMVAGSRIAMAHRHSDGIGEEEARVGTVLMATIVLSSAAALVGGLFRGGRVGQAGETVAFLQNSLWFYVLALAMISVMVAGIRMAWEQRAQPGRDLVKSLLTLLLITGAALPVLGMLVAASDAFSEWIITGALNCDPTTGDGSCFERNIGNLFELSSVGAPFLVIVLGLAALLTSLFQIMLMIARAGMLVVLAGILPLTAAATNTEMGMMWFKRAISWLVAWLLYKPAAAIVYATAFHLVGTDVFQDDKTGLVKLATGLMLMILAIVALPALMRFVTPAVGSMASGGGGSLAAAAAAVPAMGAVSAAGRLGAGGADQGHSAPTPALVGAASQGGASGAGMSGGGNTGSGGSSSNGQGPSFGGSSSASNGSTGTRAGAPGTGTSAAGGSSQVGAGGGAGRVGTGSSGGAAASGGGGLGAGAGSAGGGAASGAGAGASSGAAAASGAAAGPVGMALGAAAEGARKAGQAAEGAIQATADGATARPDNEGGSER